MHYFWGDTVTVTIDAEEIIDKIPSKILDKEYKERKELQRLDPKQAEKEERWRNSDIDVEINLDEYNLVEKDKIQLNDFNNFEIIDYLEDSGYSVFENSAVSKSECSGMSDYIHDAPKWKFKEILCDTLGLSHLATKEEIINEIKNRL